MFFKDKIKILFDYILLSCFKSWEFYKRRITQAERGKVLLTLTSNDIHLIMHEVETLIKKFVVFLPFKSTCIQRCIAVYRYFLKKGFKVDFMVGIRLAPYKFHCWLSYNGEIVFDSPAESKYFQIKEIKISEYLKLATSRDNNANINSKE